MCHAYVDGSISIAYLQFQLKYNFSVNTLQGFLLLFLSQSNRKRLVGIQGGQVEDETEEMAYLNPFQSGIRSGYCIEMASFTQNWVGQYVPVVLLNLLLVFRSSSHGAILGCFSGLLFCSGSSLSG